MIFILPFFPWDTASPWIQCWAYAFALKNTDKLIDNAQPYVKNSYLPKQT